MWKICSSNYELLKWASSTRQVMYDDCNGDSLMVLLQEKMFITTKKKNCFNNNYVVAIVDVIKFEVINLCNKKFHCNKLQIF